MLLREAPPAILPAETLAPLADLIALRLGLAFQGNRLASLARGLGDAAAESGFADATAYAAWLLKAEMSAAQLGLLASHVTIGETYFFREPATLDALRHEILPELLAERRGLCGDERTVRLWSAGCASGEEPYSLAMLLDRTIAESEGWTTSLLATDVNPHFLAQARRAIYRDWSFRGMPEETKRTFFRPAPQGGFEIAERLRRKVQFASLNLAEPIYPSEGNGTAGLDVILCRNVLIYFAPDQAMQAATRLAASLRPGGRLLIGAAEAGLPCFAENAALEALQPTVYGKRTVRPPRSAPRPRKPRLPAARPTEAKPRTDAATLPRQAEEALRQGRHAAAIRLAERWNETMPLDAAPSLLLARIHADRGVLAQALEWTERALTRDGTAPEIHYLRATILLELGRGADGARALNRALYLVPDFVPGHYGLGLLALQDAKTARARRHFDTALRILGSRPDDESVSGLDGITVRDLADIIRAVRDSSLEAAS